MMRKLIGIILKMEDGFIPKHLIKPPLKRKINSQNVKAAAATKKDDDIEFKLKKAIVENPEVRRNPKRQVGEKNYEELEEPQDDRYVFCDFCDEVFVDNCAKCGQLSYLRDEEVPMGTENRAKLTVPKNMLVVRPSPIHGFGVFAKAPLKKGIKMGPYEGKITKVESTAGYSWKLSDGKLVDAADERFSNWMRFINCARHFEEQNVVAFQYRSNLYYRTCRNIQPGQELLVYYGHSFAQNLGIDVRKYFEPKKEEMTPNPKCCPHCNYGYKDLMKLKNHLALCRWNPENFKKIPEKIYFCKFCPVATGDEEYFKRHEKNCQKEKENNKTNNNEGTDETKKKKFQCQNCEYSTDRKWDLKRHAMIHNTGCEKKFNCDNCDYSTNHKKNLNGHKRIHEKTYSFTCRVCQKGFNHQISLSGHLYRYHLNSAEKKTLLDSFGIHDNNAIKNIIEAEFASGLKMKFVEYKCQQCTFATTIKTHLRYHLNIHGRKLIFSCFSCKFTSVQLKEIHQHLKNNCGGNLSKCERCENSEFCEKHIRKIYKNEEGFTCGICGHISTRRGDLKTHISSVHLEEKNYKCQLCDYSANLKISLKEHINAKHSKSNKYTCNLCEFSSFYKSDLKRHIKRLHVVI